jgi:hypothetical protein
MEFVYDAFSDEYRIHLDEQESAALAAGAADQEAVVARVLEAIRARQLSPASIYRADGTRLATIERGTNVTIRLDSIDL